MNSVCPNPQCRAELMWDEPPGEHQVQCPVCGQSFVMDATGAAVAVTLVPPSAPSNPPALGGIVAGANRPGRPGKSIAADVMGVFSLLFGGVACLIQLVGGLCCGWIGWPIGAMAVLLGIITLIVGNRGYQKILGALGIFLTIVGLVLQVTGTICLTSTLAEKLQRLDVPR